MNKDQLDGLLALKLVADKRNFTAAAEELGDLTARDKQDDQAA